MASRRYRGCLKFLCGFLALIFSARELRADGFRNPFQSGAAIAQGNAFTAQADDASAVFYNPAGMAQLRGVQLTGGIEFVNVNTRFRNAAGQKTDNDLGGVFGMPPPGQFFVTVAPGDLGVEWLNRFSVGFGLQNLFGFAARFPFDSPFSTAVTSAQLPLLDFKPTVAFRATDWLSLGVGGDYFFFWKPVIGCADQKFVSPGLPSMPAGSSVRITGCGHTQAVNVSAMLTPLRTENGKPRVNLGFVWRGPSDLPLEGDLRVNEAVVAEAKAKLHFPDIYNAGLAFWPWRDSESEWKLEGDLDFVRWSTIKNNDFKFSNGLLLPNPQSWHDTVTFALGTEYKRFNLSSLPNWDLALRAGYNHSGAPVPDKNFTPAFADSKAHVASVGFGTSCHPGGTFLGLTHCGTPGESNSWRQTGIDVAYQFIRFEPRTVTGSPNPTVNGRYRTTNQAITLTFRAAY